MAFFFIANNALADQQLIPTAFSRMKGEHVHAQTTVGHAAVQAFCPPARTRRPPMATNSGIVFVGWVILSVRRLRSIRK